MVASGADPGLLNALFILGPSGIQTLGFTAPLALAGQVFAFQSVVFNTVSLIGLSNAVELTVM